MEMMRALRPDNISEPEPAQEIQVPRPEIKTHGYYIMYPVNEVGTGKGQDNYPFYIRKVKAPATLNAAGEVITYQVQFLEPATHDNGTLPDEWPRQHGLTQIRRCEDLRVLPRDPHDWGVCPTWNRR
jgi:hypothetical protein